jgi:hypothetical protein
MSFVQHVTPGSFIHKYMELMEVQETPDVYDFVSALWCLSVALGRDIYVARPRAPVHLNMYVCLVSESGIMRKSTSIRVAASIVREFIAQTEAGMSMVESKITMGKLLVELTQATAKHGNSQVVIIASELAAMLGRGSQIGGVPALLTDLYDCPVQRTGGGSIHSGQLNLRNVYSSFLAGSTPTWLAQAVRPEIIAGGFTSRCYFVTGKMRKRLVAWPKEESDDYYTKRTLQLVESLKLTVEEGHSYSRIRIADAALDTFTRWYGERSLHKDTYRESFESREDGHILRLAGLLAANDRQWVISDDHVRRGINLVRWIKRCGTELFTGALVERHDVKTLTKMRNEILAAGENGITRSALYKTLFFSGRGRQEFGTLISTMHECDLVRRVEMPTKGRPKEVIIATEYLRNEQFLEDVVRKLGME